MKINTGLALHKITTMKKIVNVYLRKLLTYYHPSDQRENLDVSSTIPKTKLKG